MLVRERRLISPVPKGEGPHPTNEDLFAGTPDGGTRAEEYYSLVVSGDNAFDFSASRRLARIDVATSTTKITGRIMNSGSRISRISTGLDL